MHDLPKLLIQGERTYTDMLQDLKRSLGGRVAEHVLLGEQEISASGAVSDLERALKSLGLKYTVEPGKAHPSRWWRAEGRVVVETEMAKEELLDKVAARLPKKQ